MSVPDMIRYSKDKRFLLKYCLYLLTSDFRLALKTIFSKVFSTASKHYNTILLVPCNNINSLLPVLMKLLAQTDSDDLIIVYVNGKDAKWSYLSKFKSLTPNIQILRCKTSQGSIGSFNVLLSYQQILYSSEFVAFVSDHDDLADNWLPSLKDKLNRRTDCIGAWADTWLQDEEQQTSTESIKSETPPNSRSRVKPPSFIRLSLKNEEKQSLVIRSYFDAQRFQLNFGYMIYGLFRNNTIRRAGLLPETLFGDRFFILKLLANNKIIAKVQNTYRIDTRTNKKFTIEHVMKKQAKTLKPMENVTISELFSRLEKLWNDKHHREAILLANPQFDLAYLDLVHRYWVLAKRKRYEHFHGLNKLANRQYMVSFEK